MSGDTFTLDGFAHALASRCADICIGCDVGVVLVGEGDQRVVTAGSVSRVEHLEASVAGVGSGAAVEGVPSRSRARNQAFRQCALACQISRSAGTGLRGGTR